MPKDHPGRRHRCRRPDRLRAAVSDRHPASCWGPTRRSRSSCSRSRRPSRRPRARRSSSFDCAFPLLAGVDIYDDPKQAFDGVDIALLVGARPRSKGMERADLLEANGQIFKPQGQALNADAADDVKVLVVGNPANTNALIARVQRARRPRRALHRDDAAGPEPRGRAARAEARTSASRTSRTSCVWGNHSPSMFPDLFNAKATAGRPSSRSTRAGTTTSTSRVWASAARRSSRRAARRRRPRPRTRRSTTCATGSSGADGLRSMAVPSDGSYGVDGGAHLELPGARARAAPTRSSRASRWATSPGRGSTRPSTSSRRSGTPCAGWA